MYHSYFTQGTVAFSNGFHMHKPVPVVVRVRRMLTIIME